MIRLSLTAVAVALALPVAAQAQTALSPDDQARTVCVPKRDKVGNKIGGEVCMTGQQWQVALAKVRLPAKQQRPLLTQTGHFLANKMYF